MMCGIILSSRSPRIVAATGALGTATGTTSVVPLGSIAIPANSIRSGAVIRAYSYWSPSATANNKTYRTNISGLQNSSGVITNNLSGGANPALCVLSQWIVLADGTLYAVSSQASPYVAAGDASLVLDWTKPQSINFTAQLTVATDTLALRGALAEISSP